MQSVRSLKATLTCFLTTYLVIELVCVIRSRLLHLIAYPDCLRFFLQAVEKKFPGDREKLERMSLIEGEFYATGDRTGS